MIKSHPTEDDKARMAWWTGMTRPERAEALWEAINASHEFSTCVVAWEHYKLSLPEKS